MKLFINFPSFNVTSALLGANILSTLRHPRFGALAVHYPDYTVS
jgi:hypothetical protein